ncbi:MAG: hypothetical protein KJ626_13250 [Verrucomicrobia bacterium]|nr:hypothetical protein [Verrucomicrobiota bacterium]
MKKSVLLGIGAVLASIAVFMVGCEWSTNTNDLNTSQGAGININFSGVYHGELGGGKAVSPTSGGNIVRLVIVQSGNRIEVTDNQGSTYTGSVGAPGVLVAPGATDISTGAELAQTQINFSGQDNVSQKEISFVGIFHLVAVSDISSSSTSSGGESTTTREYTDGTNTVTEIVITDGPVTITTTTTKDGQGNVISESTSTSTSGTEFSLTEQNSQIRLDGTWIEKGGVVGNVQARSTGTSALLVTSGLATSAQ